MLEKMNVKSYPERREVHGQPKAKSKKGEASFSRKETL